jgi:peptidoglycan hydrolase CwlO-like protein
LLLLVLLSLALLLALFCIALSLTHSSEINLKQQLVDQLEKAQSSLYTMKVQYEEKVHVLQTQIKNIESERDKVLKEMSESIGNLSSHSTLVTVPHLLC